MTVKFLIVGAPRTGSTMLAKTLNNIPGICCHGELLLPRHVRGYRDDFDPIFATSEARKARAAKLLQQRNENPLAFVRNALARPEPAVGLKVIYRDFLAPRWEEVIAWLMRDPGTRIIHLKRRNSLRRYISEEVMHAGGAIHSGPGGSGSGKTRRVHIDPRAFQLRTQQLEQEAQRVADRYQGLPCLEVDYEHLASDIDGTGATICDFLSVDLGDDGISPALDKVGATDLADIVENYAELARDEITRGFLHDA